MTILVLTVNSACDHELSPMNLRKRFNSTLMGYWYQSQGLSQDSGLPGLFGTVWAPPCSLLGTGTW